MARRYVYKVYHGWAFPEYVTEFKSVKKAIAFIESQEDSDCWCFDKVEIKDSTSPNNM